MTSVKKKVGGMKQVTVYSKNACASCVMVKKWLTIKKIEYTEVNTDMHPEALEDAVKLSGAATMPVIVVEDSETLAKHISVGYKPAQLASLVVA